MRGRFYSAIVYTKTVNEKIILVSYKLGMLNVLHNNYSLNMLRSGWTIFFFK